MAAARAIVIGPSNPIVSIGPILAVGGMREALAATAAPVVAVSPLVRGEVLKGPTAAFMEHAGHPLSSDGVVACYTGLLDGLVADERASGAPTLETDVELGDEDSRRRVAARGARVRRRAGGSVVVGDPEPVAEVDLVAARGDRRGGAPTLRTRDRQRSRRIASATSASGSRRNTEMPARTAGSR